MRKSQEARRIRLSEWIEKYPGRINLAAHEQDLVLCKGYLQGDRQPFEPMFRAAYCKLQNFVYCHSFGKSSGIHITAQDKEDLIAEAVDIAIRKMERFDGLSLFSTWMIGIARYLILSLIAKRCREQHCLSDMSLEDACRSQPQQSSESSAVWEMLSGLSELDATIVRLRAVEGLCFAEIAAQLGSSRSSISFRYKKSINVLRAEQLQAV